VRGRTANTLARAVVVDRLIAQAGESYIEAIKGEGVTSANGIAKALNERAMATPRGGKWTARSVLNLTARPS
jgi:hypothetical protein